ncbi:hypothetical protein RKD48_007845 [Streptomyces ambofaciens]
MGLGDRLQTGVGAFVGRAERTEHLRGGHRRQQRKDLVDVHGRLGECSRLVQAHSVHPGQTLDGGKLLDQTLLLAEPDHADGEGERGQQDEPLGDHGHEAAHHAADRLRQIVVVHDELRDDQRDARRDDRVGDELQDPVDTVAQLGVDQAEAPGLLGELGGVRLPPDPGRGEGTRTGHHEAAGHHRVAGTLDDRIRLAREQRLVDLQVLGSGDRAVHHDLVALAQLDDVVHDDLGGAERDPLPVAPDARTALADDRELVQGPLRAHLLDDADQGVGEDDTAEQSVLHRTDDHDDDEQHADDRVDTGEQVAPDDLADAAARAGRHVVDASGGDALGDLDRRQPGLPADERSGRWSVVGPPGHGGGATGLVQLLLHP